MSRPRSERLAMSRGRPRRRAAKTHFFKYQLAGNPSRAEENDLKRALQESMLEEHSQTFANSRADNKNTNANRVAINSSTNSSDVSKTSIISSSTSNESGRSSAACAKRTRSSAPSTSTTATTVTPISKRAKLANGHGNSNCDSNSNVLSGSPTALPQVNKAIRTYSRSQTNANGQQKNCDSASPRTSTPSLSKKQPGYCPNGVKLSSQSKSNQSSVSKATQTTAPKVNLSNTQVNGAIVDSTKSRSKVDIFKDSESSTQTPPKPPQPVQEQYLKFKRESKNYAYAKMTALKVNTSKSPSAFSKSYGSSKKSPSANGVLHNNNAIDHKNANESKPGQSSSATRFPNSSLSTGFIDTNKNEHRSNSAKKVTLSPLPETSKAVQVSATSREPNKNTLKKTQGVHLAQKSSIPGPNPQSSNTNTIQRATKHCLPIDTIDLSISKNHNQANVSVAKRRLPQGSWSLLGVPEEKVLYLRNDEQPRRLICYPAIKHVEGDVIQVRDSVLLRSGAKKTDLPYIAKVCAFWEDAETGGVMMSLFWYYRPEHTEEGRKPHHLSDEIFASRHRDVDTVECIEDKCYVLTFNEYCRYKKRCKMEQVNTSWSLTDVTIPLSNECYPRRNRIPDMDVNPELVFCCRQIYDSRMRRLIKNPLINPKYGHI